MITDINTGEVLDIVTRTENGLTITPQAIEAITEIERTMKRIKARYDEYKADLLQAMEDNGIDKIETDNFTVSYVAPHMTTRVDSAKLRDEHPDVYEEVTKASYVKGSVRVRLR